MNNRLRPVNRWNCIQYVTTLHLLHKKHCTLVILNGSLGLSGDCISDNTCPVTSKLKGFISVQPLCLCQCLYVRMYIRVSVNLCLLSVFFFPAHNRPLYQPVTSLCTLSKGVCVFVRVSMHFCDVRVVVFCVCYGVCFSSLPSFGGMWLHPSRCYRFR